jgi:hypothetical protein
VTVLAKIPCPLCGKEDYRSRIKERGACLDCWAAAVVAREVGRRCEAIGRFDGVEFVDGDVHSDSVQWNCSLIAGHEGAHMHITAEWTDLVEATP